MSLTMQITNIALSLQQYDNNNNRHSLCLALILKTSFAQQSAGKEIRQEKEDNEIDT